MAVTQTYLGMIYTNLLSKTVEVMNLIRLIKKMILCFCIFDSQKHFRIEKRGVGSKDENIRNRGFEKYYWIDSDRPNAIVR